MGVLNLSFFTDFAVCMYMALSTVLQYHDAL